MGIFKKKEDKAMLKVAKGFSDLVNDLKKYEVGDTYEEVYPRVTQDLLARGYLQKVEDKKYEAVQKEQK